MTEPHFSLFQSWCEEIRIAANRHSIVFVQLGFAFDRVRQIVLGEMPAISTVNAYLNESGPTKRSGILALTDVETLGRDTGTLLGALRSKIHDDYDEGLKFVLISRYPKARFPEVAGSSILLDSKLVRPPIHPAMNEVQLPLLPCDSGSGMDRQTIAQVFAELDLDTLFYLDSLIYESMLPRDEVLSELDRLSRSSIEALTGCGLICLADNEYSWTYPRSFNNVRLAVADEISGRVCAPEGVSKAFELTWGIERSIRHAMRAAASRSAPEGRGWQTTALTGDLAEKAFERSTLESYVGAKSIKEIRDPFEWLTLGELLSLRQALPAVYGDLGVTETRWKMFAQEVTPIRNRLSHMRIPKKSDIATLKRWEVALTRNLTYLKSK